MRLALASALVLLAAVPAFGTLSVAAHNESVCSFQLTGGFGGGPLIEEPFVGNERGLPCFEEPPVGYVGSRTASQFSSTLAGNGTNAVTFDARFGVEAARSHTQVVTTSTTTTQVGELLYSLRVEVDVPPGMDWELAISHSILGAIGGIDGWGLGSTTLGDLVLDGNGPNGPFSSTLEIAANLSTSAFHFAPAFPVSLEVSGADAMVVTGRGDTTLDLTVSVPCRAWTTQRYPTGGDYAVCLFGLDAFGPRPDPYGELGRDASGDGYQLTLELSLPTECNDGADNDGDGLVDLDDAQCGGDPLRRSEAGYPRHCGLGFEAVLGLFPWAATRRHLRRRVADRGAIPSATLTCENSRPDGGRTAEDELAPGRSTV